MLDFQKRKLSVSVGAALSLSMVGFATLPLTAIAQDDEEQIEEIVVTGSLIKQADYDNANPVTVLSRDEMALTGITDVGITCIKLIFSHTTTLHDFIKFFFCYFRVSIYPICLQLI